MTKNQPFTADLSTFSSDTTILFIGVRHIQVMNFVIL